MKLAYLFSRYPVPSQTFCDTEMRALEAAGFEVEIYSCSPPTTSFRHGAADRPRAPVFYAPSGPVLACWEAEARADGRWPAALVAEHEARFGPRYDPAKRARHALYFAELARRRGVAHVHVHFANRATHAALFLRELAGVPFSFTAHAQDFLVDLGSDALLAEMCARAVFVVAVSEWSRRALAERCPAAAAKIHRIYNGLPLDRWPEPLPAAGSAGLRIFSVGRLIEFKGFGDLIDACAVLHARGVEFTCEIAGEGQLRDSLEERIAAAGLGARVRLVGLLAQDEIRARLAACDVFALACRVDAKGATDVLPTVILEAMAAGRPVVSTRLAGVPETVADGETGLLAAPGDVPGFAGALAALAGDPAMRGRFGAAGRARLVARFSAADSARQLAALFRAGPAPRLPVVPPGEAPLVCLCDHAPDTAMLDALRARVPGARWVVLAPEPAADAPVRALGFLPDALVLESDWRDDPRTAHRLESWRGLVGGARSTEAFLAAARRALHLRNHWLAAGERVRHLHACGPGALLCAWMLRRMDAADGASFLLEPSGPGAEWTGSELRRLAPEFGAGWTAGERKLAASLGENFRGEPLDATAWARWLADRTGWTPA